MIRAEPSSLMANYSKIKRVKLLWSRIVMAVEGNWNLEEQEDIEEVERRTEKLRREVVSQKVTYLFCDELDIVSKELRSRVRQATKDVVKSEV